MFRKRDSKNSVDSIRDVFADQMSDIVSLIVFGDHARTVANERPQTGSPINVLIVLKQADQPTLDRLANAWQSVSGRQTFSPMVLTEPGLKNSTDVFPVTFLEMKRCYRVLAGIDVLKNLEIEFAFLRLRCEQEFKNLSLRMQNRYMSFRFDPSQLKLALNHNFDSFVRTTRAALHIADKAPFETGSNDDQRTLDEMLERAATCFGLDPRVLNRVQQENATTSKPDGDSLASIYVEFINQVSICAIYLDRMTDQVLLVDVIDGTESS